MSDIAAVPQPLQKNGKGMFAGQRQELVINSSLFGLLIFIGTEIMFFAGLISVFMIIRAGTDTWPPAGQPLLPVGITTINTIFLLVSGFTMYLARKAIGHNNTKALTRWLGLTALLGAIFLAVQGSEWVRLISFGLTISSSTYGGTFYTLIGCHGLHVLGAMIALLRVLYKSVRGTTYSSSNRTGVEMCSAYWFFVVAIWPILFVLVYLN